MPEDQTPQGHVVPCASCKGSGCDRLFDLIPCDICGGVGSVLLK